MEESALLRRDKGREPEFPGHDLKFVIGQVDLVPGKRQLNDEQKHRHHL